MQLSNPRVPALGRERLSCLFLGLLVLVTLHFWTPAHAQRAPTATGFGLQVGQPSGVVAKVYREGPVAYDGVITSDGDDYVSLRLHRLWEHPLPDSPLHFYVGPGVYFRSERRTPSFSFRGGISAEAGLNFYAERFEVFLHVTPALRFFPNTAAQWGESVGLRYYLHQP